jgi:hypothetical protein
MKSMIASNTVHGFDISSEFMLPTCEGCIYGKHHRHPFPHSDSRATAPLELVHTDVCGPITPASLGVSKYFVTFIDDYSRRIVVYAISTKDQVADKFKHFKALAERQVGTTIKCVRSDNGSEYLGAFARELQQYGIIHQTSAPYTPQQNGVAERTNRTLLECARSMVHAQGLGQEFWAEAVSCAAYIRNRVASSATGGKAPQELWTGKKPTVRHLRVFGCQAYAHVPRQHRTKFDPKAYKCILVGYMEHSKAYRLWDIESQQLIVSRDVIFNEIDPPQVVSDICPVTVTYDEVEDTQIQQPAVSASVESESQQVEDQQQQPPPPAIEPVAADHYVRRSERVRHPPARYWEAANVAVSEPQTYIEAMQSSDAKQWESAIKAEYESLIQNSTWQLVSPPAGRDIVKCKWVFKVKHNADGSIDRYKARLVAKGYTQREGIDYEETFSPVVRITSVRILLSIVAIYDLELHQMDVKTAFLNGLLQEEVYMAQPEGFIEAGQEHLVCKLNRALYGLKQAPKVWYDTIDNSYSVVGLVEFRVIMDYTYYGHKI